MSITVTEAYRKGARSRRYTQSAWDDALMRFSARYCAPHPPERMCELETAWCDGWSSAL